MMFEICSSTIQGEEVGVGINETKLTMSWILELGDRYVGSILFPLLLHMFAIPYK